MYKSHIASVHSVLPTYVGKEKNVTLKLYYNNDGSLSVHQWLGTCFETLMSSTDKVYYQMQSHAALTMSDNSVRIKLIILNAIPTYYRRCQVMNTTNGRRSLQ